MKYTVTKVLALLLVTVLLSMVNVPAVSADYGKNSVKSADLNNADNGVITVANSTSASPDYREVYEARFLNMLNHNYVYNEAFNSVEAIVNDSMPALINLRESEDSSFIAERYVSDYIFNMYGITVDDYSKINSDFDREDGFVYIIPRGYSTYVHKIASVTENEDGSFTVKTNVTISSHDSGEYTEECETLFVRNEKSQFGFVIIYSFIESSQNTL